MFANAHVIGLFMLLNELSNSFLTYDSSLCFVKQHTLGVTSVFMFLCWLTLPCLCCACLPHPLTLPRISYTKMPPHNYIGGIQVYREYCTEEAFTKVYFLNCIYIAPKQWKCLKVLYRAHAVPEPPGGGVGGVNVWICKQTSQPSSLISTTEATEWDLKDGGDWQATFGYSLLVSSHCASAEPREGKPGCQRQCQILSSDTAKNRIYCVPTFV